MSSDDQKMAEIQKQLRSMHILNRIGRDGEVIQTQATDRAKNAKILTFQA